ncbi:MAG: hypothetical protein AB8C02_06315 [Halioglobus sp.]
MKCIHTAAPGKFYALTLATLMTVFANGSLGAAKITHTTPDRIVLFPGKNSVVTLHGTQLEQIKSVSARRKNARTRDVSAKLTKSRGKVSVSLGASSRALGNYTLEIQTGGRPYSMPVEVVTAAAMRAALAGKLPAIGTTQSVTPKVAAVSPARPTLYAGAKAAQVTMSGSNLDKVGPITVIPDRRNALLGKVGRAVSPNKMIKRVTKNSQKLSLSLQAVAGIAPGSYILQVPLGSASGAPPYTVPLLVKSSGQSASGGAGSSSPAPVIQAFTVTKSSGNVAVKAGDTVEFQLTPPVPTELENAVTITLVEANQVLGVSGQNMSSIARRYQIQVPQGLALGPHTVKIAAGSHSDTSEIYVYPTLNPDLAAVVSNYGSHPSGAKYLHYNEPITLTTNGGGFDFAKMEVHYPQGGTQHALQKTNATTLRTASTINFQSLGALNISANFGIDAASPSFVAGANNGNGFIFKYGTNEIPVHVVGKPKITSCSTPGAPSYQGYPNPVFPGVDIELHGENLLLPASGGINPSAGLGFSANNATPGAQIMPGSTAEKLILRLPPNPSFANMGSIFTVNNGVVSGSSTTPSCIPNSVNLRVSDVQPDTLFSDPATTDITISGAYLGWLGETVSLNGVQAEIRQRTDHTLVVRWSQPIQTGLVTVETKAGTALTTNNSGKLTVVEQ